MAAVAPVLQAVATKPISVRYVRHFLCCERSLGSHRAEFGSRWWCKSPAVICQKHSVAVSALIHFTFPEFCQSIHEIKRGPRAREMQHRALVTAFSAINASFFARNCSTGNRRKTQISGPSVMGTSLKGWLKPLFGIQDKWLTGTKPQTPAAVGSWHQIL